MLQQPLIPGGLIDDNEHNFKLLVCDVSLYAFESKVALELRGVNNVRAIDESFENAFDGDGDHVLEIDAVPVLNPAEKCGTVHVGLPVIVH